MSATARNGESTESREALETLCRSYWPPIYAFLRRRGQSPADAEDLVQGFLCSLLAHQSLAAITPDRGRFRAFLLVALRNFLADQHDRTQALKRGGGQVITSLDAHPAEALLASQASQPETPESAFDRQWAWSVMHRARDRLQAECRGAGKASLYDALGPRLLGEPAESLSEIAARLGMSENALRVAAFRLRQRYQQIVRDEIRQTVDDYKAVDAEIRHLLAALTGGS